MQKRKKVLYIITKSNWGGAQRYVYDLATHLPTDEFEVVVVAGGMGELIQKLQAVGVRTHPVSTLTRDIRTFDEVRSFFLLLRILRHEHPDIVHVNSSKAGALGAIAARCARIPYIIFTGHGWAFNEDRSGIQKLLIRLIVWFTILLAHRTICVSEQTRMEVQHLPFVRRRLTVIHNGTEEMVRMSREEARQALTTHTTAYAPRDAIWIGTIAELHPSKGHRFLLTALTQVQYPWVYVAVGDGEQRDALQQLARELGINTHVHWVGHVSDAPRYLNAFDIFVLPSLTEALSLSILEAGMAGVPVIASNVGGIPEILPNNTYGRLVSPQDPQELSIALNELCRDAHLRAQLGASLKQRVTREFSMQSMCNNTFSIYRAHPSATNSVRCTV